jgi:MFS family permease
MRSGSGKTFCLQARTSSWFVTAAVSLSIFTVSEPDRPVISYLFRGRRLTLIEDTFVYAMLVPIFPFVLPDRFGVQDAHIPFWSSVLLAAYAGPLVVTAPISGAIIDRWHVALPSLRLGLLLAISAAVMIGTATSLPIMVLGRAGQGVAAGVTWVAGPSLLVTASPGDHAGRGMGFVSLACTSGYMLSPLLSGLVYRHAGYRAVLAPAYGLIACNVVAVLGLLDPQNKEGEDDSVTVESPLPPSALSEGSSEVAPVPGQPPINWKSPAIWACVWANCVANATLADCDVIIPAFASRRFHWDSMGTGLIMFSIYGPNVVLGPCVGTFSMHLQSS